MMMTMRNSFIGCTVVILAAIALSFLPSTKVLADIQQPAHVYGAFVANDCAKLDSNGFVVSYGTACGNSVSNALFGCAGTADSAFELRKTTGCAATPTPTTGTLFHISGTNSTNPRLLFDAFASNSVVTLRRADGTVASPSAVGSTVVLGSLGAIGYGATGYSSGQRASVNFTTTQAWADANQGARVDFVVTPNNSATPVTAMTVDQDQSLSVNAMKSGGTKFTISGCSAGTTVGGAAAGLFTSGTTGVCTVVITINGATGLTASNGWACHASDLNTPANLIAQSAFNQTTATLTGTTVSGDVVSFSCMGF